MFALPFAMTRLLGVNERFEVVRIKKIVQPLHFLLQFRRNGWVAVVALSLCGCESNLNKQSTLETTKPTDGGVVCSKPTYNIEAEPEAIKTHCENVVKAECSRAFDDCLGLKTYGEDFVDAKGCQSEAPGMFCDPSNTIPYYLDEPAAIACEEATTKVSCEEIVQEGGPKACWFVKMPVPPEPSLCRLITPGKYEAKLDTKVSMAWGGYASLFCLCLSEGDTLKVRVDHGDLDSPAISLISSIGEVVWSTQDDRPFSKTITNDGSYLVVISESYVAINNQLFGVNISVD